ncbi:putative Zinc finger CCCH domain-containing protein 11 [Cocos nucifera]|uniref:Putative Zinc finger CCCH domain-containing protein 11 n=1 Tax=Cocos nucifera TaxID=13894 RepID=A0A8K0NAW0_COCNU|nr:putative Zinc finger CCCH domain-containing protein 11 [Cocos nucifera]
MPPKRQPSKTELAKKQKVIEDKTFGLKNKNKSKNVQKYVQSLQQTVQPKPDSSKIAAKKKKEEDKAREKELNDLFKIAVSQPKVPVGVDPKSILCEFFKAGQCQKGFKCKFSHDLNVQRKGEKIDLYSDKRDQPNGLQILPRSSGKETVVMELLPCIEMWVCKYFLEAVEKKQYGWFWVCPNGGKDCHYRHALPPGYVLKSQMKALLEEETEKISIEEEIENQRAKISASTPLTPELFMQWKRKKMEEREASLAVQRAERAKSDRMSGRELFLLDSSVFVDDAEAYDKYQREEEYSASEEVENENGQERPGTSTSVDKDAEEVLDDDDDEELDIDELDELEASLSKTSIQIRQWSDGLRKSSIIFLIDKEFQVRQFRITIKALHGSIINSGVRSNLMLINVAVTNLRAYVTLYSKLWFVGIGKVENENGQERPGTSTSVDKDAEEVLDDDDDEELDIDELDELEASLSKTSIQIREPDIKASS